MIPLNRSRPLVPTKTSGKRHCDWKEATCARPGFRGGWITLTDRGHTFSGRCFLRGFETR